MSDTGLPPINNFESVICRLSENFETYYTCPDDVNAIVLMMQAANTKSESQEVAITVRIKPKNRPSVLFANNISVFPGDAVSPLTEGKLVLKTGDELQIKCNDSGNAHLIMSVLENAER